jgi:hypothetical protein
MDFGRLGVVKVALHDVVATHQDLAGCLPVVGNVAHFLVDDADRVGDDVVHTLAAVQARGQGPGGGFDDPAISHLRFRGPSAGR